MITITEEARAHMASLILQQKDDGIRGIRLAVLAGGCSGMSYDLDFEREPDEDALVLGDHPRVYVDRASLPFLEGMTLRYQGGLSGRGLIFENPRATSTCGCGSSFSAG